jgi:hypothetical protein
MSLMKLVMFLDVYNGNHYGADTLFIMYFRHLVVSNDTLNNAAEHRQQFYFIFTNILTWTCDSNHSLILSRWIHQNNEITHMESCSNQKSVKQNKIYFIFEILQSSQCRWQRCTLSQPDSWGSHMECISTNMCAFLKVHLWNFFP